MYSEDLLETLEKKAKRLRRDVIVSIGVGVAGHIGGSNSSADIVTALYFYKMRHDPQNPEKPDRDRFLLSKGHAAILQYAALAESGYFPVEDLKHTKELGSYLQGHPDVRNSRDRSRDRLPGPGVVHWSGNGSGAETGRSGPENIRASWRRRMPGRSGVGSSNGSQRF